MSPTVDTAPRVEARHRRAWGHPGVVLGVLGLVTASGAAAHAMAVERDATLALAVAVPAVLLAAAVWAWGGEDLVDAPAWFLLAVVATAILSGAGWGLLESGPAGRDVAVAVLTAASPAALILAGPAALRAARRRAAPREVTLPEADAVRRADDVQVVVLDKDGTVTTGDLTVISVDPVEPDHDRNLRWFAGALGHASQDRIGRAVATLAGRGRLSQVEDRPGEGISGSVDRHPVRVGDPGWLGMKVPAGMWTTVGVEVDARALGTITIADQVRPDAADGVRALREAEREVVLVSSDRAARVRDIAARVGVETVHAPLTPEATAELLSEMDGSRTLWAGPEVEADVLDVRRLGVADLSVARIADALAAAGTANRRARRARGFALTAGLVGALAAAAGLVVPWIAVVVAVLITAGTVVLATGTDG